MKARRSYSLGGVGLVGLVLALTSVVGVFAQQPLSISAANGQSLGILQNGQLLVKATPSGDYVGSLSYTWSVPVDPTGLVTLPVAAFPQNRYALLDARHLCTQGPPIVCPGSGPSFIGQQVTVRVTVTDETPDTPQVASHDFVLTVTGIDRPPQIVVDVSGAGNATRPIYTGEEVVFDAGSSSDPDGDRIEFRWAMKSYNPASLCESGKVIILYDFYDVDPGFEVPRLKNSIPVTVTYQALSGIWFFEGEAAAYIGPPPTGPCTSVKDGSGGGGGNTSPVINSAFANPSQAAYGQQVFLNATVSDAEQSASTLGKSWIQLSTTGGNAVQISNANTLNASFTAPGADVDLRFRFTVTDSGGLSASREITVPVRQSSGGGGGGGGGQTSGGTSTGSATGTCISGNSRAVAGLPAYVEIDAGGNVSITASNPRDPDNTLGPLGFSGVTHKWTQLSGSTVTLNPDNKDTIAFVAPNQPGTVLQLNYRVLDAAGCGTNYPVEVRIRTTSGGGGGSQNNAPNAVLRYTVPAGCPSCPVPIPANSPQGIANGASIGLVSPLEINLDATASTDSDGTIANYVITSTENLLTGGVSRQQTAPGRWTLTIAADTVGTYSATVSVVDDDGASSSISFNFTISNSGGKPLVSLSVMVDGLELEEGQSVEEGALVTLDASGTELEDGTAPEFDFVWRQLGGPPVMLQGQADSEVAFLAPLGDPLVFRLVVRNGDFSSDPFDVEIPVAPGFTYFPQVAVGVIPGTDEVFETVVVLSNNTPTDAEGVGLEFFAPSGDPIAQGSGIMVNGQPWNGQTFSIKSESVRILRFSGQEIRQGWARLTSEVRLDGQVFYRIVVDGQVSVEVPIFSAVPRDKFVAPYSTTDDVALAVVNPGELPIEFRVRIIDASGDEVRSRPLALDSLEQKTFFIEGDVDGSPLFRFGTPEVGSMVVETEAGQVVATILKTRNGGRIYSTVPLPNGRR